MKPTLVVVSLLLGLSIPSLSAQRILHLDFLVANASDRVAVLVSLQAGETKVMTLQSGTPAQMVRLKARFPNPISASRLGGGRGILWESENAAFVWQREGAIRPVTKLSARTVLEQMPAARRDPAGGRRLDCELGR